jgi:hypothetical protein
MARRYDPNQPRVPEGLPGAGQWRGLNLAQRLVGEWRDIDTRGLARASVPQPPKGFREVSDEMRRELSALGISNPVGLKSAQRGGSAALRGAQYLVVDGDGREHRLDMDNAGNLTVRGRATDARPSSPQTPARSGDVLAERLRGEMSEAASAPSAAWTPGRKPEFTGSVERRGSQYIFTVRANGQVVSTRRSARRYAYANVHMDGTVKYSWAMDTRGTVHPVPLEGADKPDRQQATRDTWVVTFADGGTAEVELEQSLSTPAFMSARQKFPGRQVMRVTRKR